MSIHPSLKSNRWKQNRSVRKRWERLEKLNRTKDWIEKNATAYGLPKEKIDKIIFKIKDEKNHIEKKEPTENLSITTNKKAKKKNKDITGIR